MGKRTTYLGGSTVLKTRNLYSQYPYSGTRGRKKFVHGALPEMTPEDYAAEIAACREKLSSVSMALILRPLVVKAIRAIPLSQIRGAKPQVRRERRLPGQLDGRILASVRKSLGRTNLEESKRRTIRSIAIDLILNSRSAKR